MSLGGSASPGAGAIDAAGTESGTRERLGDYYLYPLAARTTIADAQQKQVSFLDVQGTPARATYEYVNGWLGSSAEPMSASSVLKFSTSRQGGLGDQLPAGTIRVYMRDARGDPQFIGENRIDHTPMGSSMALRTGGPEGLQKLIDSKNLGTIELSTGLQISGVYIGNV